MNHPLHVGGFRLLLLLSAILAAPAWLQAQPQIVAPRPIVQQAEIVGPKGTIHVKDLEKLKIIGLLGLPLGEATTIEGEVVAGDTVKKKDYIGPIHLKVTSVGGRPLQEPVRLAIQIHDLCRVKPSFGNQDVGKTKKLLAYEAGFFDGIPDKLPLRPEFIWSGMGFRYGSYLVVLEELK